MPNKKIIMHQPERHPEYFKNQPKGEPVGWCNHNKHRGKLSVRLMKNHKCLGKKCPYFKKNDKHPYWAEHERIKQIRKDKKKQDTIVPICETCGYMYQLEPKPGKTTYAKHMVRYCSFGDDEKIGHHYCSTRNRYNKCPHYVQIKGENI